MGLLDLFKKKEEAKEKALTMQYAPTMAGNTPFYSSYGDSIYASDIVMQSIRCKANEFKKLQPRHIVVKDGKQTVITNSSVAKILENPNPYMTMADFLEKITILLELNKNVFIYPEFYLDQSGARHYTGLYPLKPTNVQYLTDEKNNIFLSLDFANGSNALFKSDEIIHWRKDFGVNDFFGGSMVGYNDNRGLLKTLSEYDKLTQSIATALDVSCNVNGILQFNSYLEDNKMKANRENFIADLKNSKSGILFTDMATTYTPISRDVKIVDSETLKFYYETILRHNSTSLAILNGDYTPQQKQSYYEHALEGDIISLGQAFSKVLFAGKSYSYGNKVVMYPEDIYFWSPEQKNAYMSVAVPAGALSVNQILKMGGLPPIEGGDEIRPQGYNKLLNDENKDITKGVENE